MTICNPRPVELELGTTDVGHLELRLVPAFDLSGHMWSMKTTRRARRPRTVEQAVLPPGSYAHMHLWDPSCAPKACRRRSATTIPSNWRRCRRAAIRRTLPRAHVCEIAERGLGGIRSDDTLDVRNGSGGDCGDAAGECGLGRDQRDGERFQRAGGGRVVGRGVAGERNGRAQRLRIPTGHYSLAASSSRDVSVVGWGREAPKTIGAIAATTGRLRGRHRHGRGSRGR
jgi:hypothetical protein